MNDQRPPLRLTAIALLLPLLVAGCSHDAPPDAGTPVTSPYAAVARGRVDVEGGLLQLGAPREGTLASVDAHEGERVRKGQLLATLDATAARLQVGAAEAALAQAQAQQPLLAGQLAAARQRAQRLTAAAKAGAGDGESADAARGAVADLVAEKTAAEAAVAMARQKLEEARYELTARTLRAPLDAQVIQVMAQPGATVSPAAGALFTLLPQTPRIVRAELSESFADAVTVGMPATVSGDGSATGQSWAAHVLRIGSVLGPSTLDDDPQQRTLARTVSCVLAFDQAQSLRVGQRVLVRFGTPAAAARAKVR